MTIAQDDDTGSLNLRWSLALLEGMIEAGLEHLVLSPGARSTPLVIAGQRLEQRGVLRLTPVLDERSAAFFALGLARARLRPVALLSTSGSAPAHWYPAVIEAAQVGLPLLLLSADRPSRLQGWGANQTIDQTRLFGAFVREFHNPGLPQPGAGALKALRALGRRTAAVSQSASGGPVHLNLPFDEPLVPVGQPCEQPASPAAAPAAQPADHSGADVSDGLSEGSLARASVEARRGPGQVGRPIPEQQHRRSPSPPSAAPAGRDPGPLRLPAAAGIGIRRLSAELRDWPGGRGLIVCGPAACLKTPLSEDQVLAQGTGLQAGLRSLLWRCADVLALPVLVDPLSGLRTGPGSSARVSAYDAILRNPKAAAALRPDWVLRIGEAPVSKRLGQWLEGVPVILATASGRWPDPSQDAIVRLELPAHAVCEALVQQSFVMPDHEWLARWVRAERRVLDLAKRVADGAAASVRTEAQVLFKLRQLIPKGEALFCANSMPIRQLDCWWGGGGPAVTLLGNRGASGIDGYLSTLAGLCDAGLHCWGLTGDLSFCHDLSGLLLAARLDRPLLVLNNNGGHIFDYLPQRDLADYERLWQTPQSVSIADLARIGGLRHWAVEDQAGLDHALAEAGLGPGVIEVRIDPEQSLRCHLGYWSQVARADLLEGDDGADRTMQ